MVEIVLGVFIFTAVVLALVGVIMLAKKKLVASGDVEIVVNEQKTLHVPAGGKLLGALADAGIFVSSACGGGGTCAQCLVKVTEGGGDILPPERSHINRREARGHVYELDKYGGVMFTLASNDRVNTIEDFKDKTIGAGGITMMGK